MSVRHTCRITISNRTAPLSRKELAGFGENGLKETDFREVWDNEDEKVRFIVEYLREDPKR